MKKDLITSIKKRNSNRPTDNYNIFNRYPIR